MTYTGCFWINVFFFTHTNSHLDLNCRAWCGLRVQLGHPHTSFSHYRGGGGGQHLNGNFHHDAWAGQSMVDSLRTKCPTTCWLSPSPQTHSSWTPLEGGGNDVTTLRSINSGQMITKITKNQPPKSVQSQHRSGGGVTIWQHYRLFGWNLVITKFGNWTL